jgi:protein-tyrosine kinase
MSEFFRALEQAERERALRRPTQASEAASVAAPPAEPAVVMEPAAPPPVVPVAPPPVETPVAIAPPVEEPPAARAFARPSPKPAPRAEPVVVAEPPPAEGVDGHLVSLVTPTTFEAEQYRTLRHMIEHLHASAKMSVIACTSATGGDGKTTTSINLAGALAQAPDTKVLLVDADLRRPSVARALTFGSEAGPGLVGAILHRDLGLADVVRRRPPFNLAVVPAGRMSANPYELLKSPRLAELMDEARQQYDFVVVDTPPLVSIPDCRAIARCVDGFLVIVAAHRTPRKLLEEALTVIEPAKVIGLVFNGDDRPLAGYYSYSSAANGKGSQDWRTPVRRARKLLPFGRDRGR